MKDSYDYIIIGSGIVGLTIAHTLRKKQPGARILVIDKEGDAARHASGRNSGVLHTGFYYTADSLKARFTVQGNRRLRAYCADKGLRINECGKLVVARDETELFQLYELERRGKRNGSNVRLIDEGRARELESNVRTFRKALHSPDTATVDPAEICLAIKSDLSRAGVEFRFRTRYLGRHGSSIKTTGGNFCAEKLINCAGLYADKIARDFGFGRNYVLIPFKGLYLKYTKNTTDVRMNIYPVPNLKNPFLGVHFTKTVDGTIKIGPTATPAFWRENYQGWKGFRPGETSETLAFLSRLFFSDSFGFRGLAFDEMRKYNRKHFIHLASEMVQSIDPEGFGGYTNPGIRAQLLDKRDLKLVQDFVIEGDGKSIHVLNAVSPAFTCSFPFAEYTVDRFILTGA